MVTPTPIYSVVCDNPACSFGARRQARPAHHWTGRDTCGICRTGRLKLAEWTITGGPTPVQPLDPEADEQHWLWTVTFGDTTNDVRVVMSGTLAATDPDTLPSPIDQMVASKGETEVRGAMQRDSIPSIITITPNGVFISD